MGLARKCLENDHAAVVDAKKAAEFGVGENRRD